MPELPEIETVKNGIKYLEGNVIKSYFKSSKKLRISPNQDLKSLIGAKITRISRRARYLIINLDNSKSLILHLGMSGKISIRSNYKPIKHDHFICNFTDESYLVFNDPRRFGFVDLVNTDLLAQHQSLANLGPEPLEDDFNQAYLSKQLSNKKINIKTAMMNNKIVVGVGNIYINESLFDSKISPLRPANDLNKLEIARLVSSVKKILKKAIKAGGSSISDYKNAKGEIGYFQHDFKVYDRDLEKCLICKNQLSKVRQNGRSTFYCSKCQK